MQFVYCNSLSTSINIGHISRVKWLPSGEAYLTLAFWEGSAAETVPYLYLPPEEGRALRAYLEGLTYPLSGK